MLQSQPEGQHGHTRAVEGCKGQSCIRVRSARGRCFRFVGDRVEFNQAQDTSKDVGFCSEKNQSGAKGTMGEAKLGSGRCQTACLSSIEKENGSRTESTLGEG